VVVNKHVAALVCGPELVPDLVPVVIGYEGDADALLERAVAASGLRKASGTMVAVYEDGVSENPFVRVWDASYGGVWASLHPDAYDFPEWPGLVLDGEA
jgi:hypothetical protein